MTNDARNPIRTILNDIENPCRTHPHHYGHHLPCLLLSSFVWWVYPIAAILMTIFAALFVRVLDHSLTDY